MRWTLVTVMVIELLLGLDAFVPMHTMVADAVSRQLAGLGSSSNTKQAPLTTAAASTLASPATLDQTAAGGGGAATAPGLALTPKAGGSGTSVKVNGTNFPHAKVQIMWDGNAQGMPMVQANANGVFSTSLNVPTNAASGNHIVGGAPVSSTGNKAPGAQVATTVFSVALAIGTPTPVAGSQTPLPTYSPPSTSLPSPSATATPPPATSAPTATPVGTATPTPTTPAPTATPTAAPTATPTAAPTATPTPAPPSATPPPAAGGNPAPPQVPSGYAVPPGAVSVSTSAGLASALAAGTPQDIVLAAGVYDNAGPFSNPNGHRLYSATLGGAVLHAGIVMGANYGPGHGLVRGITFDVTDPAKTLLGSIIHIWGTGVGSRVLDSTFYGHAIISSAIMAKQPEGVVVQRVVVRDFIDWGVIVDANVPNLVVAQPPLLEDLDVANVSRAVPLSSNGTSEACVWLGNTGTVRRALLRHCAWMGLWTGTANTGALHEDLNIDYAVVGAYLEHFTTGSTFQRFWIGPNTGRGFNNEWADPAWGGRAASVDNVIQDSTILSLRAGVNMDQGTTRATVRRVRFVGQTWAGIGDYLGNGNSYYDNDFTQLGPGAIPVIHDHYPFPDV